MSEEIIYSQIPKLPSTLSDADTCKICKGTLLEKYCKVYLYDVFMSKAMVANIKMLYCEECNMPYCTRHHESYVKKHWPELTLRAIPVLGNAKAEKMRERCKSILFDEPESHADAPLLEDGTQIYVGTKRHICGGEKRNKLTKVHYKVITKEGKLELRKLRRCEFCGKLFIGDDSYENNKDHYDDRYVFITKDRGNKSEKVKTIVLKPNSNIYVGTHNSFPSLCIGKKEDIVPINAIMENSQGDQERHLLSRCEKCGKVFMKTHIYGSWSSYYPKYNYVLPENLKKEEALKKEIVQKIEPKVAPKNEPEKTIVENYVISPKHFLTRVHIFQCTNRNHKLLDVIATVKVLNSVGVLKEVSVPAAYCKTCNKYYILETEYQKLKKYGHIVCKVVENTYWTKDLKDNPFNLNEESVLHLLGYNVNAQANLSQSQRWGLLEIMVDEKVLTRMEICSHLDYLINRSKNRKNFDLAISKWKSDRAYISKYVAGSRKVEIGKITVNVPKK